MDYTWGRGGNIEDDQGGDDIMLDDATQDYCVPKRIGVSEEEVANNDVFKNSLADDTMDDGFSKMPCDVEPLFLRPRQMKKLEKMRNDDKIPLFLGCEVSKLEFNLMLLARKSTNGLSGKGFKDLQCVLKKLLPSPNELPKVVATDGKFNMLYSET